MTLLDFVKQFVRVHNLDQDWYYYETGDDDVKDNRNLKNDFKNKRYSTRIYK